MADGTRMDLNEFVDANLTEVADWELNFRMLKVQTLLKTVVSSATPLFVTMLLTNNLHSLRCPPTPSLNVLACPLHTGGRARPGAAAQ